MLKPPLFLGAEARKKPCNSIIPRTSATFPYLVSESPTLSPPLQQQGRSACSSASPSPEPQEPALRIELVPVNLTVGVLPRFWLIHQESGLRFPGQFSYCEAEHILQATAGWDWEIDYRPRTPRCSYQLFSLLKAVCTPQKTLEVAE